MTFTEEEEKKLNERIREAGTAVVNAKAGAGSATLSMAYAAYRFCNAVIRGLQGEKGVVECSYVEVEGMEVPYFGVPVEFGKNGIEKILPLPKLNKYEEEQLKNLIPLLKQNIETALNFVKNP